MQKKTLKNVKLCHWETFSPENYMQLYSVIFRYNNSLKDKRYKSI